MKRAEINAIMREADQFIRQHGRPQVLAMQGQATSVMGRE
jgi:D-lyxose ketol-isomerase